MAEYNDYKIGYEFSGYTTKKITAKSEQEARDILRNESNGNPISPKCFDSVEYTDIVEIVEED